MFVSLFLSCRTRQGLKMSDANTALHIFCWFFGVFFWANRSRNLQKAGYPVFETSIRIVIAEGAQRAEKTVPVPGTPCPVECSKPFEAVMAYSSGLL